MGASSRPAGRLEQAPMGRSDRSATNLASRTHPSPGRPGEVRTENLTSHSGHPVAYSMIDDPRTHPFDAILFDLFGTLVSSGNRAARIAFLEETAGALDLDPESFAKDFFGSQDPRMRGEIGLAESFRSIAASHGRHPTEPELRRAVEIRANYVWSLMETCSATLPVLDDLRRAGLRLAVVSDCSEETPLQWPRSPLSSRAEVAVFSCQVGCRKPDGQIYEHALRALDLPATRCAFVGDGGSHELTGATKVGLSAFLYRFPADSPDETYQLDRETDWSGPVLSDPRSFLSPRAR